MEILRPGSSGPAVAEVRAVLRALGLLTMTDDADADRGHAVFDAATELAVRHFQQVRGLSVDGIVGPESYRALAAARWRLGDRLLSLATRMYVGDDVAVVAHRIPLVGVPAPVHRDVVDVEARDRGQRPVHARVGAAEGAGQRLAGGLAEDQAPAARALVGRHGAHRAPASRPATRAAWKN